MDDLTRERYPYEWWELEREARPNPPPLRRREQAQDAALRRLVARLACVVEDAA